MRRIERRDGDRSTRETSYSKSLRTCSGTTYCNNHSWTKVRETGRDVLVVEGGSSKKGRVGSYDPGRPELREIKPEVKGGLLGLLKLYLWHRGRSRDCDSCRPDQPSSSGPKEVRTTCVSLEVSGGKGPGGGTPYT